MKLLEILRFEVAYHVRRPSTWVYFGALVALAVMLADSLVEEARGSGSVHANAPLSIATGMAAVSMVAVVVTAALFSGAATRDVATRMHPLFYTAPLRRGDYLGGRFLGAFAVNALLLAAVPLGLALAQMPEAGSDLFGPFRPAAYLQPYLALLLPNLFVTGAVVFTAAALSGRALGGYVGGLLLFLGSVLTEEALAEQLALRTLAALVEPFGFTTMSEQAAYWTPAEQNARLVSLDGTLLWNRLLWIGIATSVLAVLHRRFQFEHTGNRARQKRAERLEPAGAVRGRTAPVAVPHVARTFGFGVRAQQALVVARQSIGDVLGSRLFLVVLAASLAFLFVAGWEAGLVFGAPTLPVTYVVAQGVLDDLAPIVYLFVALYAGELVWRERDAGLSEIADAAPVPTWVPLAGTFAALVGALAVLQAVLMAGGVLLQVLQGYHDVDLGLYVQILFGLQLPDYVLWAALAVLVHVLVNNKVLGHGLFALYYLFFRFGAGDLGVEHHLLLYPAAPGWIHSDLSGFGPFLAPYLWFKVYWGTWALLFAAVATLFWVRGREPGVRRRIREARSRLSRPAATAVAACAALVLLTGGFVFYNTNVLNDYRPLDARIERVVEYERLYKRYDNVPQPRVTGVRLRVEIYPERRAADLRGHYALLNRTGEPIDSLHVMVPRDVEVRALGVDRAAERVVADDEHGYHVFALTEALQPGDSLRMTFDLALAPRGFPNSGVSTAVVENGTSIRWSSLPSIGYDPDLELRHGPTRQGHGLPARDGLLDPGDPAARRFAAGTRDADWIDFEAVVGTAEGQTAVAPGSLRRTWVEDGRRYAHYATDAPIRNFYGVLSAEYAVVRDRWDAPDGSSVALEIYHHPDHTANLDRMLRGLRASLAYYAEHFGPYPHRQLRIVEFPRHDGTFARSYPTTVAFSEGFGFLSQAEDGLDHPFAVTAHEVAHQWWGNQVNPAAAQGASTLTETLAHYGALMVLEETYGRAGVERFLSVLRHRYLIGRRNREGEEVPLLRSEDQDYVHYDKGAVAMYTLQAYVGEGRVNTALRRFADEYRFGGPPYPTTLDLYAELQAVTPDSLQALLADLFEDITLWELRASDARAEPTGAGAYRVTLDVEASKVKADGEGHEAEVPMDDWVEVGVFADGEEQPLYLRRRRVRSGAQTITVTVPRAPARVALDPRHRQIARPPDDHVVEIEAPR